MANFGVLDNNLIINILVCETKEIAEIVTGKTCIELPLTNVGIGWSYDGAEFTAPVVEETE